MDTPTPRADFERWLQTPAMLRHLGPAQRRGPIKGYPIGSDFLHAPTYGNRVLLVGEAAGLVNPLTGDGIDFALETGRLAAEYLAGTFAAGDFSRQALAGYDRQLRRRYAAFFRFCMGFRHMAMMNGHAFNLLMRTIPKYPTIQHWLTSVMLGQHLGQPAHPLTQYRRYNSASTSCVLRRRAAATKYAIRNTIASASSFFENP